jgi:putative transposase
MLLKIAYLLIRRLLGLAVLVFRTDMAKDAELLVLRHENAILPRHAGRVRDEPTDRVSFAALARLIPGGAGPMSSPSHPGGDDGRDGRAIVI